MTLFIYRSTVFVADGAPSLVLSRNGSFSLCRGKGIQGANTDFLICAAVTNLKREGQKGTALFCIFGYACQTIDNLDDGGQSMKTTKKILDYEYEEVLDAKTRELIRVACAVAVGCPD